MDNQMESKSYGFLTNTCTELAASDEAITQVMNEHYTAMKGIIADYLKNGSELQNVAI